MNEHNFVKYYLEPLLPSKNGNILDFGCGAGGAIQYLQARGFTKVHGFEREIKRLDAMSPSVRAAVTIGSNAEAFLAETREPWDAVLLRDVLYYFDDADALHFLRRLQAKMNKGSPLLIEVFNGAAFTGPYVQYKDRGIKRIFTEHSLTDLVSEAGFKVEYVRGIGPQARGFRSLLVWLGSRVWIAILRLIYWTERGWDSQNPGTLEKKFFVLARKC